MGDRTSCGHTFPVAWVQASVTGAVPPPHRLRGRLRLGLGLGEALDAARKALPLHKRPAGGCGTDRVASSSPWRLALQHRPLSPSARCRHEAAELAGGYPLRIVRIAPLHDAGITVSSTRTPDTLRSLLSWAKIHSHACRGASRRSCPPTQVSERTMRTRFVLLCQGLRPRLDCRAAAQLVNTDRSPLFAVPDAGMRLDDTLQPGGIEAMILQRRMMTATGLFQPDR